MAADFNRRFAWRPIAALLGCAVFACAGDKWMQKDYKSWTAAQSEQMLSNSPWARMTGAVLQVAQEDPDTKEIPLARPANVPDPGPSYKQDAYGVDDGKWDGGVMSSARRGEPNKLPVMVRWDSARPVRCALLKTHAPESADTESTLGDQDKDYVITVLGLVAGHKTPDPDAEEDGHQAMPTAPYDATGIRQALLDSARLARPGKKALVPEDVHLDEKTGTVQIFFPRKEPITLEDKAILFHVVYGNLRVEQPFRLRDMVVDGKLQL